MGQHKEQTKKRIGIMGGSFDPVHTGHVNLARDALAQGNLDQVLLIPARLQPFKQDRIPASGEDRMAMLQLALAEDPQIEPCDYELRQEGVSYTYLTLRAMQERFGPESRIYFIIGTDSLMMLDSWMQAEELLVSYGYIVGSRPGYRDEELAAKADSIRRRYGTEIIQIANRRFDISATEIRQRLADGASVQGLIPDSVADYIREHGLYGGKDQPLDEETLHALNKRCVAYLRDHLKPSRYEHILRVRDEAVRLAKKYGADPARAETAALFHDMAKTDLAQTNALVRELGLQDRYLDNPNLAHSKVAAALMRRDFGITDEDLLHAVAYHTTGRAGMSLLEKIVFLADGIEPGRAYPSVDAIRALAERNLDAACALMLERTIRYLEKQGADIDPDTQEALSDLRRTRT